MLESLTTRPLAVRRRAASVGALAAASAVLLALQSAADRGQNAGIFRDARGGQHSWVIQPNHLLEWDDKPYQPVGVVFYSAYLKAPSQDTLRADQTELDRLKAAGISDVWVEPGRPLLECTPVEVQALIDQLESVGFRYGLRIGDRLATPLVGHAPSLLSVRVPPAKLQPNARFVWKTALPERSRAARFMLTDDSDDGKQQTYLIASGDARVEGRDAVIDVQLPNSRLLGKATGRLSVLPEVAIPPTVLGSYGDLWDGLEAHQKLLKQHIQSIKFGPGLRFLLDPFAAGDGSVGEEDGVFPAAPAFRSSYQDWLQRQSGGIAALNVRWRMADRHADSFEVAARLVPMWAKNDPPEGDGWIFDPIEHKGYRCNPRTSAIWNDLEAFRVSALKRWMNTLTNTLKSEGLNVPMLFTWEAYHPVFSNTPSPSGYDGLAGRLSSWAPEVGPRQAALALSQAEQSDRTTWLIAGRVTGPPAADGSPTPVTDAARLRAIWAAAAEAGFRGLYMDPRSSPNAAGLVKDLAASIGPAPPAASRLSLCFYPVTLSAADGATRFKNGVWWLPSNAAGRLLPLDGDLHGYEIRVPFGEDHPVRSGVVLWSSNGPKEMTIFAGPTTNPVGYDSAGKPFKLTRKKHELRIKLTEEPVVVAGVEFGAFFPVELVERELKELEDLIKTAETRGLDAGDVRSVLVQARQNLVPSTAAAVYQGIQPHLNRMRQQINPYIWIEAERTTIHNFSGTSFQAGASSGSVLRLDRQNPPASGYYRARYVVDVVVAGAYEIWLAGKAPGSGGASPLVWQVDDEALSTVRKPTAVGGDYAPGMTWFQLGRLTLGEGRHEISLVVTEKNAESGRFAATFDSLVVSREPFQPNGVLRPVPKRDGAAAS